MRTLLIMLLTTAFAFVHANTDVTNNEPADVAGSWIIDLTFIEGEATHTATISQDGETLTGSYKGEFLKGDIRGTVSGNDITFSTRLKNEATTVGYRYTGTVSGHTITGTVDMGEYWTAEFTANRTKND